MSSKTSSTVHYDPPVVRYALPQYGWASEPIKVVEINRETAEFVFVKAEWRAYGGVTKTEWRRRNKDEVYPTWAEARDAIVADKQAIVEARERQLQQARSELGTVNSWVDPTQGTACV